MITFRNRAEWQEWVDMNDDNAQATDATPTPSEYVTEHGDPEPKDVSKKFGRVWQAS